MPGAKVSRRKTANHNGNPAGMAMKYFTKRGKYLQAVQAQDDAPFGPCAHARP